VGVEHAQIEPHRQRSDFPHPEGMGDPLAYSEIVADLPFDEQALIMGGSLDKAMCIGRHA
jgi:hypothetical protein